MTSAAPSKRTVLLVDDEGEIREFLGEILSEDYQTRFAASGEEALESLRTHPSLPDLILLDLRMPGIGGHGLLEALRAQKQFQSVPVLVLTALPGIEPLLKSYALGADDYLTKPFHPGELMARVRAKFRQPLLSAAAARDGASAQAPSLAADELLVGRSKLRKASRELLLGDERRKLRESEYRILHCLLTSKIGWRTREELAKALWQTVTPEKMRSLDPHISSLRKKLEGTGAILETHYGRGYQIRSEHAAATA